MIAWNSRPVPRLSATSRSTYLHDTAAGRVVEVPFTSQPGLYVCGITPYDATHLGHAATYVAFDLLNRIWRDAGAAVSYVQNVTDIDDPLLIRATETGVDWRDLAESQTALFRKDMEALNVLPPDHYVGAVESIGWIVPVIESFIERGAAYRVAGTGGEPEGDIYFSLDAARRRGEDAWTSGSISHLTEEQMLPLFAERGGDPERPGKRNSLDPLVWRIARAGEPDWEGGSLGRGRPGWHIECSVIAQKYLSMPMTVQAGGADLVYPHHEMSAAHAQAVAGIPLARHYVHAGMVGLDGKKMSKSKGNLVLVSTLRESGTDPAAIRLALLANHYRRDWSWTASVLTDAEARLDAWRAALDSATVPSVESLISDIRGALANDLDAPGALAAVDRWCGAVEHMAGDDDGARLATDALDALLGVRLKD
ncbi:cysteine--1-D-myo-inosityl 2-amino-2-deoxy-alpha-D-glucopyranoside ligase [Arthrobacter sp. H5]|uniref:cysteine--1-D-myo-inosityl 2-amino-2-deoxy-alpha-D-glucopyranoside ligase n=1 Tax=Arthrobacter sp. H5 TaxID=1267973 RepID=UPI000486E55A|nr:cysteine--1-D-myo-inosityl 2-amino-2-deoxy-alpha-D-glucopyranoside ligase [Arthrobacter sp. H5]